MTQLRLAEGLALPLEAAAQTFLVVGKRGSGKTTTAVRLAEQFHHAEIPFVIIDPVDNWWGLKASRDGKGPGLSVYVFGGRHADLPLEPAAGTLLADVLVEHRISAVLSVKHFSGRERGRFVADFTARLFKMNTEPLHLFLEEAHEVAPQQPYAGEEEMLGHVTRIWKLGRSSGLGGSAITQRPASLNKNITTQAEILIVHRTLGPQDVAAIREWIRYHGEREDILAQLSTLKTGEAFIWAPDFPEGRPIGLRRITVLERETFDSAATPKVGERRREPKRLADVDLERLRARMTATIERAKQDDPRELRRQVAELKAQLSKAPLAPTPKPRRIEVPVVKPSDFVRAEALVGRLEKLAARFRSLDVAIGAEGSRLAGAITMARREPLSAPPLVAPIREPPGLRATTVNCAGTEDKTLTGPERKLLTVLAQHGGTRTIRQLALQGGYAVNGGGFRNPLGRLRSRGFVKPGDPVMLTEAGLAALGEYEVLPTGRALLDWWLQELPGPESKILKATIAAYPSPISVPDLAKATGYDVEGGGFRNPLGRLRTLQLIVGRGEVRLSEEFFA